MATIINTPGGTPDSGNSAAGWIVAIVAIVLLGLLGMWFYNSMAEEGTGTEARNMQQGNDTVLPPPTVNNNYNTTLNSTTTVNNSTTTED